ncbi:hypothetical protein TNCV_1321661 [Trichonephila clavipes]|nr:hypothetical protein TNCV_1321661 [Trichonephila clavipes]
MDECQPVMSNVRDDLSVCGRTRHVPSSSSSWVTLRVYRPSSPPGGATAYQLLHHSINRQVAKMVSKHR